MISIDFNMYELIAEIRPYFDNTILKRGWAYYKEDAVLDIYSISETKVAAEVSGSSEYMVELDLAYFPASDCSCPYGDFCKHMAAVLFEVCEIIGENPKEFLSPNSVSRTSQGRSAVPKPVLTFGFKDLGVTASPSSKKAPAVPKPQEVDTPKTWQLYFEQSFAGYPVYSVYDVERFYDVALSELDPLADKWEPLVQSLYHIHLSLFMMKKSDEILQKFKSNVGYYYSHYDGLYKRLSRSCVDRIKEHVYGLRPRDVQQQYPTHLMETMDYLAAHAFPEDGESLMDWQVVYRLIWWNLLNEDAFILAEQQRLRERYGRKTSDYMHGQYALSLAHFEIMAGQDEAAREWLDREGSHADVGVWMPYLQTFTGMKQWDRLINWLRWLRPQIQTSNRVYIEDYLLFLQEAGKHLDLKQEWIETAKGFLPYSYFPYAAFLMGEEHYRSWADLCMYMNLTPQDVDAQSLKLVEKADPRSVLPFYHHAVDQYIQEKNRDSYKQAVKIMKKLHRTYKKLKELERWELYLQHTARQYSRYRAFQEELRKGKLIV
jgi:hypothetical protein